LRPSFWVPVAALTCASLSATSVLYPEFYPFGWIAFVPFLLGLHQCRSAWQAYGFGLLTGLLAFGFSAYGMTDFIQLFKGYSYPVSLGLSSLFWVYCAQTFGIIAVVTHFGRRGNAVLWVFPTILALVFAFYPALFPWQIGNSQSEFLVALQATEITGVSGLDFIIGLVNVLIAQALIGRQVFFQRSVVAAYALVAMWFSYGVFSLSYWDNAVADWETLKVGFVQPDEPPIIGTPGPRPGFTLSYPIEMDLTEQLVAAGADLVIWPELRNKQYYTKPFVKAAYQRQVANLETALLFQSYQPKKSAEQVFNFNTATLIDAGGSQTGQYQKMKRIPLAEYLPVLENSEIIKGWFRRYMGEFFGDYSAGSEPKSLDVGKASVTPFICFEILYPHFVADATHDTGGDILTVQSNNSWFGDSRIPHSHMGASVVRSVENRRPLVHVMNNGLGGAVLPSGRVLLQAAHHEIAGYLLDLPYNKQANTTFYSRFPYWLVTLLGLALVGMLGRAWRR